MNKGLVSGLVLLTIGLVCGILLSVVNSFTAPRIKLEEDKIKYQALEEFYTLADYDISEYEANGAFATIYILKEKGQSDISALVYTVSAQGFAGPVQMLIAVNSDLSVEGYKVVSHTETSGYGADIVGNNFGVSEIDDLAGFDAVSGVTKTSNAIKECFNLVAQRINSDLGGGLSE
ncbi:MAG: FMN-binding protein [Candidatus Izemoplasmatales bacterium]|nr:FMN-binding protein [Candidatus Izemoplasmatales bacterium]